MKSERWRKTPLQHSKVCAVVLISAMIRGRVARVAQDTGLIQNAPSISARGFFLFEPPNAEPGPSKSPRPIEALLAGYASGALNPYLHALIEAHLILSPDNRDAVVELEAAVGDEIETIEPKPLARSSRDHVLAAIYAGGWYGQALPMKVDPDLPYPISRLVGAPLDKLPWRFAAPGVREHKLHDKDGLTVSLIRVKAGRRLPHHTHDGHEATLVLKGAFSDHLGHYRPGDVALADPSVDHRPVADAGEPCVCFVVTDAPLKLTGPIGRLVQKVFGG